MKVLHRGEWVAGNAGQVGRVVSVEAETPLGAVVLAVWEPHPDEPNDHEPGCHCGSCVLMRETREAMG